MRFEIVYNKVKDVPFISDDNAKSLYEFILKNKPQNILELGIAHGTASCYMAAALDEIGGGRLTCVDLLAVKNAFKPSIEEQLSGLALEKYVEVLRMQTGYNWFLHNEIKSNSQNHICNTKYDLIIIDGPKNWTIDSSSFFLCDKLLNPNGWIIWDDYNWTYAKAGLKREATDGITHRNLSVQEQELPHIKEIFELLVVQHPDYTNFMVNEDSDWAWAQKVKGETSKEIKYTTSQSFSALVVNLLRRVLGKIVKRRNRRHS